MSVRKRVSDTLYGNINGIVVEILKDSDFCSHDDDCDWHDITILTSDGVLKCIPRSLLEMIEND